MPLLGRQGQGPPPPPHCRGVPLAPLSPLHDAALVCLPGPPPVKWRLCEDRGAWFVCRGGFPGTQHLRYSAFAEQMTAWLHGKVCVQEAADPRAAGVPQNPAWEMVQNDTPRRMCPYGCLAHPRNVQSAASLLVFQLLMLSCPLRTGLCPCPSRCLPWEWGAAAAAHALKARLAVHLGFVLFFKGV